MATDLSKPELRCLLVYPRHAPHSFWNYREVCRLVGAKTLTPPLGLLTLAGMLPKSWSLRLVDENVAPLADADLAWADLVCTGGMLTQAQATLTVSARARQMGKPVAVGGPDPTLRPEIYAAADYLVLGEGELAVPQWLTDFGRGAARGRYQVTGWADLDASPLPRFDLIRREDYLYAGIQFSRGCPHGCEFCDIAQLAGRSPRVKSPSRMLAELMAWHDLGWRHEMLFVDDNLTAHPVAAKEFLRHLIPWQADRRYPFFFACQATVAIARDEELLRLLHDAGFRYAFLGLETPEPAALAAMGKSTNLKGELLGELRRIQAAGIHADAGFILGSDGDSPQVAEAMLDFIGRAGLPVAMVGMLNALPGTPLAERLQRAGRMAPGAPAAATEVIGDQMLHGLNFQPTRPRKEIIRDLIRILDELYKPQAFFARVTDACLRLGPRRRCRQGAGRHWRDLCALLAICRRLGGNPATAGCYWRMLWRVLLGNPRGLENAVSIAAMYLDLAPQARIAADHWRATLASEVRS